MEKVEINGREVRVEVAADEASRARGLSGRARLAPDAGLLFIFATPAQPGFWMKEMNFAIDIIWLDEQNRVVDLTQNFKPDSYPEIIRPKKPVKAVLEVNAGLVRQLDLKTGDLITVGLPEKTL